MTTEPVYAFGVEYESDEGTFVSEGWDEKAAAAFVRDHSARQWRPTPVRVVRRPVGEWEPAPAPTTNPSRSTE